MSLDPSNSDEFEEYLESARRGIRKLEVDTYRLRTDLTRLEAALEEGFDSGEIDSRKLEDKPSAKRRDCPQPSTITEQTQTEVQFDSPSFPEIETESNFVPSPASAALIDDGIADEATSNDAVQSQAEALPELSPAAQSKNKYRRKVPSVFASLGLHGALMLGIFSIGVATVIPMEEPYMTAYVDLDDKPLEPVVPENLDLGQIAQVDETQLQETDENANLSDLAGPLVDEVTPIDFDPAAGPLSIGDLGPTTVMKPLPTGEGTVQAGNEGLGPDGTAAASGTGKGKQRGGDVGKRNAGPTGAAMFFGAKAKGDRFVFVVDNSSSMKNGRLEMAVAELVKTVYSLSTKQSFYVIFVSDQTYPMFYPQPELDMIAATPLNKKRLTDWLPKAILASGKNRELIKAMDMAASLNPHAVYLLWDGDMRYSDNVRLDVMTHLTAPNMWNFTVHTIGMGVTAPDAVQNLTAIAEAHGGMYRYIDVPTARKK